MKKMIKFIKEIKWFKWLIVAIYVWNLFFLIFEEKNYLAAFYFMVFLFIVFLIEKIKKLEYFIEKIEKKLKEPQASEFENALGYKDLYTRNEDLVVELLDLKGKNEKLENKLNSYLITILLENKEFLKTCDNLLLEGKEKYPNDDWKEISFEEHFKKAKGHLAKEVKGEISDHCSPHGVSAFLRIMFAMINKYKK